MDPIAATIQMLDRYEIYGEEPTHKNRSNVLFYLANIDAWIVKGGDADQSVNYRGLYIRETKTVRDWYIWVIDRM